MIAELMVEVVVRDPKTGLELSRVPVLDRGESQPCFVVLSCVTGMPCVLDAYLEQFADHVHLDALAYAIVWQWACLVQDDDARPPPPIELEWKRPEPVPARRSRT